MASGRTMRARSVGGEGRALGSRRLARLPETLRRVWKALSARTRPRPTREVAARCAGRTGGKGRWGSDGRRATGEYLEWWLENCISHSIGRGRTAAFADSSAPHSSAGSHAASEACRGAIQAGRQTKLLACQFVCQFDGPATIGSRTKSLG